MKINFFLNVLSIHQAPLIRKLSEVNEVSVFYDEPLSAQREDLGWYTPEFGLATVCEIRLIDEMKLISEMSTDTVNIFSGLGVYPSIKRIMDKSLKTPSLNYVQMESLNLKNNKGLIRKVKYRLLSFKYNNKLNGIFSQGGKSQLEKLGFKNVHDFAYFLDISETVNQYKNNQTKFIYIGAISKRKRILKLVQAIHRKTNFKLDIYGAELDVPISKLESAIERLDNVVYKGVVRNDKVLRTIKKYDYLVLPSKSEGWGAVISEALLCGVGVIVSDVAGVVNYLENKPSYGVFVKDFSNMNSVVKFMETLSPLEVSDRDRIQSEAYCLSSDYGVELINRYIS